MQIAGGHHAIQLGQATCVDGTAAAIPAFLEAGSPRSLVLANFFTKHANAGDQIWENLANRVAGNPGSFELDTNGIAGDVSVLQFAVLTDVSQRNRAAQGGQKVTGGNNTIQWGFAQMVAGAFTVTGVNIGPLPAAGAGGSSPQNVSVVLLNYETKAATAAGLAEVGGNRVVGENGSFDIDSGADAGDDSLVAWMIISNLEQG